MNLLIHNVLWVNPGDPLSETLLSIRIKDGLVVEFGPNLKPEKAEAELQADGQYCSPGWVDLKVNLGEPARPQNEGLVTLSRAAAAGGFTEILVQPNVNPVIQTR